MSADFPNEEQIKICKQEVTDRIMGSLLSQYDKLRLSSAFKYQDCVNEAGNNIVKFVHCYKDYDDMVRDDNENLHQFIKSNYAEYLWIAFLCLKLFKHYFKMDLSHEYLYKSMLSLMCKLTVVILIGDVDVGKTCLLSRYLKN